MYNFDAISYGIWCNGDGSYFAAGAMDTVYMFGINRYLQYLAREHVKVLKLMEEDRQRAVRGADGKNYDRGLALRPGRSMSAAGAGSLSSAADVL